MKQLLASIFGLFVAANAVAEEKTVQIYMKPEQLTEYCRAFLTTRREGRGTVQEYRDAGICYGFVIGIADTISMLELLGDGTVSNCIPKETNANTLAEIVAKYLDKNPAHRKGDGQGLAVLAISEVFHCQMYPGLTVNPKTR
jgi:hypothetical protein